MKDTACIKPEDDHAKSTRVHQTGHFKEESAPALFMELAAFYLDRSNLVFG